MSRMTQGAERGAALIISLIMLVLITLMVIAALNLGTSNFRAVSNTQFREQAIAAANVAIQDRISSTFDTAPTTTNPTVDLNNDGVADYTVAITPTCLNATVASSADPSSVSLPGSMTLASTWNTIWDLEAQVTDADSGAAVVVHTGVRVLLGEAEKNASCP
jgi:Tfp pilus assembly protein PilX